MFELSKERIQYWVREADIEVHPYLIICHPSKEQEIKRAITDERILIEAVEYIPEETIIFANRRELVHPFKPELYPCLDVPSRDKHPKAN